MRVDIHAHVIPPETLGRAGRYGPEISVTDDGSTVLRIGAHSSRLSGPDDLVAGAVERLYDPGVRLADMDARAVDALILSVNPLSYLYWAEPGINVPFASIQNTGLANYCDADPERLFFLATLPLPHVRASVEELAHACELGARGVSLGAGGFGELNFDSREMWPLYAEIERLGVPLFIHPHPLSMAGGPIDRYNVSWVLGVSYQQTSAFARLTLGGVFDDFPALKVVITHGGGSTPYQFGRLEEARRRQPDVRARRALSEYLPNVWFDILIRDLAARRFLLDFAGAHRLVVGDNDGGWDALDGFALLDELALDEETRARSAGANAAELFGLACGDRAVGTAAVG